MAEKHAYRVRVFKDDPIWEKYDRWFQLPPHELERLHIVTYIWDENPLDPGPMESAERKQCIEWVEKEHPGTMLVYL